MPLVQAPVLQSILSQTKGACHDDFIKAASWLLENERDLKVAPTAQQWRMIEDLALDSAPVVLRLHAAPGCGKTMFCLILLHGLCEAEKKEGIHRVHWITAPTKTLVSELLDEARKILPADWLAPVGSMADGSERFVKHQRELAFEKFQDVLDNFEARKLEVEMSIREVQTINGRVRMDEKFDEAKDSLRRLHLDRFDFYHGDALQAVYDQHESKVRVALSTTSYKLKYVALGKGPIQRVFRQPKVLPGGHVCDEADMVSFGALAACLTPDPWLLAPNDPAQHMAGTFEQSRGRQYKSLARTQNPNDWLSFADKKALLQTRRFGPRVKDLLLAMFPESYEGLHCHEDAPDTKLIMYDCSKLYLAQAIDRAGGVVNPVVLAMLGEIVNERLPSGKPIMIVCIYATTREIVAAYLFDNWGCNVNYVLPGGHQDTNSLWVCSARQTRGGTRPIVITLFIRRFAWDNDYEGHATDRGKINVSVTRATEEQIIFAEHWEDRPWDPLNRMMHHMWRNRWKDGYTYNFLDWYDENGCEDNPARGERRAQAIEWIEGWGWEKHIQYDSDDEDPSAVEFFSTSDRLWEQCQVTRDRQTRSSEIPRYEEVTDVDEQLWHHVKKLVVAVTVSADFDEETQMDFAEEGACA